MGNTHNNQSLEKVGPGPIDHQALELAESDDPVIEEQNLYNKKKKTKKVIRPKVVPKLTISSFTWTKESHGLFDYDLKDVLEEKYETRFPVNILRDDLKVSFSNESQHNLIAKIS